MGLGEVLLAGYADLASGTRGDNRGAAGPVELRPAGTGGLGVVPCDLPVRPATGAVPAPRRAPAGTVAPADRADAAQHRRTRGGTARFGLLVALLAGLVVLAVAADLDLRHLLSARDRWPVPMPVVAVGGCAVLVCALVPRVVLAFAVGAALGMSTGTWCVLTGVTLGAGLAFGVGRLLGRAFVQGRLRGRGIAVERAVAARGPWGVAAARMLPLVHFGLSNYAFGTTSIGLSRYLLGTAIGIAPATVAHAALGDAVARADAADASLAGVLVLVLSVAGFAGSALLWRRRPGRAGSRCAAPAVASPNVREG